MLSDRHLGTVQLFLGCFTLVYLFFILMIVPILPVDITMFIKWTPPSCLLLFSGIFGMIFIGCLSLFTLVVMWKGDWLEM